MDEIYTINFTALTYEDRWTGKNEYYSDTLTFYKEEEAQEKIKQLQDKYDLVSLSLTTYERIV